MKIKNGKFDFLMIILVCTLLITTLTAPGCKNPVGANDDEKKEERNDCEKYETAKITFKNNSRYSTYNVILDGSTVCTIEPGKSHTRIVASGSHTFLFIFTNTGNPACSTGYPNLAICECATYSCRADY